MRGPKEGKIYQGWAIQQIQQQEVETEKLAGTSN